MKRMKMLPVLLCAVLTMSSMAGGTAFAYAAASGEETKEELVFSEDKEGTEAVPGEAESETEAESYPAPDFTLTDQYGTVHTLSDYRGKVVFLNFWATWCPPCRAEMPDIQKLYEEFEEEGREDTVFLSIAFPGLGNEKDVEGITAFLEENGYTYPALMDETYNTMTDYYITAYPTTFMIDREGNIYGYVTGSISEEIMRDIIAQTLGEEQEEETGEQQ